MASAQTDRIVRILGEMSLEEKLAQLGAYMFFDTFWHKHDTFDLDERLKFIQSVTPEEMIPAEGLGFISTQLRDCPARMAAELANRNQAFIREHTRHGVPVIVHDEGVHGLIGNGATVFPSALGLAATWNPGLVERAATAIGREARTRGIRQLLSPTLNLGRDPRCGRTEETYGEDPLLAGRMGAAFVRGVQSNGVVCTPKHFVGNFEGDGGRDSFAVHFSERFLREILLPPFEACVREAGALSLMTAYNTLDGEPCTSSRWLLTDVLRDEWGFEGYVVTDYHSLAHLFELHKTAANAGEAARLAIEAGTEVELPRTNCVGELLAEEVRAGRVTMEVVDRAVGRVLAVKERIGLLDDPMADPDEAERVSNCPEHRALAREAARQSVVLLKNENALLPLRPDIQTLAVIGPNADSIELGDYSWDLFTKKHVVTPLEGILKALPSSTTIRYAKGCDLTGSNREGLEPAVEAAAGSEAAVVFVGSSVKLAGEARDRTELDLPGLQEELIHRVVSTGTPTVVVIVTGGVHTMRNWVGEVDAILHAWYAGEEGGSALAELLFGVASPSGRLPITIPRSVGQCPVYYNHRPSGRGHTYTQLGQDGGVLFPFGHGLAYTSFEYANLRISPEAIGTDGTVEVTFDLRNAGRRVGTEVAQLYLRDEVSSVARPLMELVGFERVMLEPDEVRTLRFELGPRELALLDRELRRVVEPGSFRVMVGASSADIRLEATFSVG